MDTFENQESQRATQASNTTKETHCTTTVTCAVSELLEDAGNCRQSIHQVLNPHPLGDSLFSEQQKLRVALDWAHSFLSSRSDFHDKICRTESLKLADTQQRETETPPTYKCSSSAINKHSFSCTEGGTEVLDQRGTTEKVWQLELSNYTNSEQNNYLSRHKPPSQEDLLILFTSGRDDVASPENRQTEELKSLELQQTTSKQTPSHHNCRTSKVHTSNHRHHLNLSDSSSNQTFTLDAATSLIKGATSCWSSASKTSTAAVSTTKMSLKNNYSTDTIYERAQSEGELSGNKKGLRNKLEKIKPEKEKTEDGWMEENENKMCRESSSVSVACTNNNLSHSEPERISEQTAKTANPSFTYHLKIPSNLTVYEQYQLCVDRLHHLRLRKSTKKEIKTTEETAVPSEAQALPTSCFECNSSTTPEIKKHIDEVESKRLSAAEITEERASDTINENQNRTTYKRKTTLAKHEEIKQCVDLNVNETPAAVSAESRSLCQTNYVTSPAYVDLNGNSCGFIKRTAEAITSADKDINTHTEHSRAAPADLEGSAAPTANPGTECHI